MRMMMQPVARAAAIVAFVAVPVLALAQTQQAAQQNPAAEHLSAARAALNKVLSAPAPTKDTFEKLSQIKTEYLALEKSASTRAPDWESHYQRINALVTELLAPTPASAEAGAVGTSGTVNPAVNANLMAFRTELAAFAAAMKGGGSSPAAAPAAPPAAATAPASAPAAAPVSAESSTAAAPAMPATSNTTIVAQLDQLSGTIDAMLKASGDEASGKVTLDRATLEELKAQIGQIKESLKKQ